MAKTTFPRPYLCKSDVTRYYPYSEQQWRELDCYDICRLGGGDFFFIQDYIGSGHGKDCLAALDDGTLLADWMIDGKLNWDSGYTRSDSSPFRARLEKHVWLNRLYFLLPIAQDFFRTRDEARARQWIGYLRDWWGQHPYNNIDISEFPRRAKTSLHCWVDMQVAFRLIIVVHCVYLLAGSKKLTRKEWHFIYDFIRLHVQLVHEEVVRSIARNNVAGNHFLQKANALFYVGILMPEIGNAQEYLTTARRAMRANLKSDFTADGGNVEACPAYSHFIVRFLLDIYLLLKINNLPQIPGLASTIRQIYRFLAATMTPNGQTAQFSDSYAMDATADLKLVRSLLPGFKAPAIKSVCFPQSRVAVLRREQLAVHVDASGTELWHHHEGKPNFLFFVREYPVIIDSGSGTYDHIWHWDWLKRAEAHNTVVVNAGTKQQKITFDWDVTRPRVSIRKFSQYAITTELTYEDAKLAYNWIRTIKLGKNNVTIHDDLKANQTVSATIFFHLSQPDVLNDTNKPLSQIRLRDDSIVKIIATDALPDECYTLQYRPAVGPDNRIICAPEISLTRQGREFLFRTEIVV